MQTLFLILSLFTFSISSPVFAQSEDSELGDYFGFSEIEIIKIGDDPGPMYTADVNSDGLMDILVINNRKSRIDILLQKPGASPEDTVEPTHANEIPEHWRFEKKRIMVSHNVSGIALYDFNDDGRIDVVYAGNPTYVVFMEQLPDGTFKKNRTHRVKNISANRTAFSISDVIGDEKPELITIVGGNIELFPIDGNAIGKPFVLATEDRLIAFELADYVGNGLTDIAGLVPDSSEPVRLWLSKKDASGKTMGPQLRFEMPSLREFASVNFGKNQASKMAIIERASRRIVLYEVDRETIESSGDREASIEIYPFLGSGAREQLITDANNDGLLDVVATNPSDNTVVVYQQIHGEGLHSGVSSPTLTSVGSIAVGDLDNDGTDDLFVLSEDEGVVGKSPLDNLMIPFPQPIPFSIGNTPVSLSTVTLNGEAKVVVISKDKRNYFIDVISNKGELNTIDLGSLSRGPDKIIGFDADQDGNTDLLILTRDKPMKLLHSTEEGFVVLDDSAMGQYGLVRAASGTNTILSDVDNDGLNELLIADDNYVRAVRYEPLPPEGVSPGWQVVNQVNLEDGGSNLVSIAQSEGSIYVADNENERIVLIQNVDDAGWKEQESLYVHGYDLGPIYSGDFTSDGVDDIVAMNSAGFAIIQIEGERIALNELQSWRSDNERRVQHELAVGDVNADGYSDIVSLDAGEQMLEIFTFADSGTMLYVTGFKIFESRIFSGGEPREWQPSQIIITDLSNDGKQDVLLLAHDRLILYKQ
ncbi:MAG: hypothetical protein ACI9JK_001203 [Phycisphaerales bacterium]|jgi:hypothetical protein